MRKLLFGFALICTVFVNFATAQNVKLTINESKTGAKIDRNIFGQFAQHLGFGVYEGIWVGKDSWNAARLLNKVVPHFNLHICKNQTNFSK